MTARIVADRDRCVGAGQCALVLPEVFDSDDDGLVTMVGDAAAVDVADLRLVVRLCPAGALGLAGHG
ncbi:ferredoxin [Streptosporangium sp. NPDC004631]